MSNTSMGQKSGLWLFAVLVLCLFTLTAAGAWTRSPAQAQAKTVTVTITPGTPPTVSPDPAEISKGNGDQVEWSCPACNSGFSVHFPASTPFASSSFNQRNRASGRARNDAATGLYHYSVTVNGHTADPGVKVTP